MSAIEKNQTALFMLKKRLETFQDWPFTANSGAVCTAEKLAETGFYRPNPDHEPDLTRCFVCHKELEGWEDNDDPESEHASHSSSCPFLSFKERDALNMKIKDFIKLLCLEKIYFAKHTEEALKKESQKEFNDLMSENK